MSKYAKDLLERVGWTAAEAGASVVTVESLKLPPVWTPIIAVVLAAIKGYIAKHVGNADSASTVPSV